MTARRQARHLNVHGQRVAEARRLRDSSGVPKALAIGPCVDVWAPRDHPEAWEAEEVLEGARRWASALSAWLDTNPQGDLTHLPPASAPPWSIYRLRIPRGARLNGSLEQLAQDRPSGFTRNEIVAEFEQLRAQADGLHAHASKG